MENSIKHGHVKAGHYVANMSRLHSSQVFLLSMNCPLKKDLHMGAGNVDENAKLAWAWFADNAKPN